MATMDALIQISDSECYSRAKLLDRLADIKRFEIRLEWLERQKWVAVPAESAARIPEEQLPLVASAIQTIGSTVCWAVCADGEGPPCYEFSPSISALREFNQKCGFLRYLLAPLNMQWAIFCGEDVNIFAGPRNFVVQALGMNIERARQEYREWAATLGPPGAGELLLELGRRYEPYDGTK